MRYKQRQKFVTFVKLMQYRVERGAGTRSKRARDRNRERNRLKQARDRNRERETGRGEEDQIRSEREREREKSGKTSASPGYNSRGWVDGSSTTTKWELTV
ncbi:hypothetical protein EVAR_97858_1 [Eumeta japonica]|uniref:Uncharacterized protein n=1 Tax=Eumeta variegata TaxID=151549 RepID=A0A4C1WXP9_EUMVA|nr:hypothetical protein EVAR_97858_1 [Eumeta japonica]